MKTEKKEPAQSGPERIENSPTLPDASTVVKPSIDPDFKDFLSKFLASKAWLPWVERRVRKLLATKEGK
jgi:hypothetical protein